MILELDKKCSLDVLFKYMGRTPAATLAEFVELGRIDSSKKMVDEVGKILREFLRERASRETDPEAGRNILSVYLEKGKVTRRSETFWLFGGTLFHRKAAQPLKIDNEKYIKIFRMNSINCTCNSKYYFF